MGVSRYLWIDLGEEGFLDANNNKMLCPHCGVEMNHHCDKLVYGTDTQHEAQTDPGLGGMVQEFDICPKRRNSAEWPGALRRHCSSSSVQNSWKLFPRHSVWTGVGESRIEAAFRVSLDIHPN
jgi:ribosomal protein S27AE